MFRDRKNKYVMRCNNREWRNRRYEDIDGLINDGENVLYARVRYDADGIGLFDEIKTQDTYAQFS